MAGKLSGRVAVVTGGASGIGRATVLRFLEEGARVVVADLNESNGKETLAIAEAAGLGEARFTAADVVQEDDVAAMIAFARSEFGRIDCVFNNAGVSGALGPLEETRADDWDYTFDVLCRSVFLGIKHATRAMTEQGGGGVILNTASVAGLHGGNGPPAYSAAKAAVINLTRAAARELAPRRIRVNAICPGVVFTPLAHAGDEASFAEAFEGAQPWPVPGRASDIAAAALYLASDDASFVTGEALVVDGGATAVGASLVRLAEERGFSPLADDPWVDRGNTGLAPLRRGREPR